ncbi:hypothetical protein ACFY9Q_16725 [Streptomyces sp. NPDC012389]
MNHWIPVFPDAYSSYNKPRHPGLLAGRMLGKLRGVTVVAPECLA